jgi:hypothetical protein
LQQLASDTHNEQLCPEGEEYMTLASAINAIPTMLTIWAAITACFVAILTYRGQLTRYEQDRLFLTNINPDGERKQTEIVHRIQQIQPYVRILGAAATLVTILIVGIWTLDAWHTLHP